MTKTFPILATALLAAQPLSATVLAYEGFDPSFYSDGTLSGQGTGSGTGFTGNWGTPSVPFVSSSRTPTYWSATGGASTADNFLNYASGQAAYTNNYTDGTANQVSLLRNFNTETGTGTPNNLYASALITIDGTAGVSLGFIMNGFGSTYENDDRPFQFGFTENGNLFAQAYAQGPNSLAVSATSYSPGTYLLVARFTDSGSSNDSMTLWLDPGPVSPGTAALVLNGSTLAAPDNSKSSFFVQGNNDFRLDGVIVDFNSTGTTAGSTGVDEIRIGTVYANVVPEPSTALLGALGALCLLRRRR